MKDPFFILVLLINFRKTCHCKVLEDDNKHLLEEFLKRESIENLFKNSPQLTVLEDVKVYILPISVGYTTFGFKYEFNTTISSDHFFFLSSIMEEQILHPWYPYQFKCFYGAREGYMIYKQHQRIEIFEFFLFKLTLSQFRYHLLRLIMLVMTYANRGVVPYDAELKNFKWVLISPNKKRGIMPLFSPGVHLAKVGEKYFVAEDSLEFSATPIYERYSSRDMARSMWVKNAENAPHENLKFSLVRVRKSWAKISILTNVKYYINDYLKERKQLFQSTRKNLKKLYEEIQMALDNLKEGPDSELSWSNIFFLIDKITENPMKKIFNSTIST